MNARRPEGASSVRGTDDVRRQHDHGRRANLRRQRDLRRSSDRRDPEWDVIIVGAGPAGSTCAALVAGDGHEVLLLERELRPGACANCTGIIGEEAFQVFDLPRDLVVNSFSDVRFIGPYRREVEFDAGKTLAHVVRRYAFDAALAERAAQAGAELRTGVKVTGGERRADGVVVEGVREAHDAAAGKTVRYRGRVLVLATGYNLKLLRAFGMEGPHDFVQGVQLLCPNRGVEQVEVYVGNRFAPGSFGWAVPMQPGWVKVGLTTSRQARAYLDALAESDHLRQRVDLSEARLRVSPIPVGTLPKSYADRLIVVGEAAGQVKTTSNGGIYYSMLGAQAAAEVLNAGLRIDSLSERSLETYEVAWRQKLEAELAVGRRLRSAFESMSDAKLAGLMWLASVESLMDLIRDRADFDWHQPLLDDLVEHRLTNPFFGSLEEGKRARA